MKNTENYNLAVTSKNIQPEVEMQLIAKMYQRYAQTKMCFTGFQQHLV